MRLFFQAINRFLIIFWLIEHPYYCLLDFWENQIAILNSPGLKWALVFAKNWIISEFCDWSDTAREIELIKSRTIDHFLMCELTLIAFIFQANILTCEKPWPYAKGAIWVYHVHYTLRPWASIFTHPVKGRRSLYV